jgi:hypothetical protein
MEDRICLRENMERNGKALLGTIFREFEADMG